MAERGQQTRQTMHRTWLRRVLCLGTSAGCLVGGPWIMNSGTGGEYTHLYGLTLYLAGWAVLGWLR